MSNDPPPAKPDWHALSIEETFARLASHRGGLAGSEATARLHQFGPNRLTPQHQQGPWRRFFRQFDNLLIMVLLGSTLLTALLGHFTDSAVILGVVVLNAIIGFVQEGKAEEALAAIRQLLSPQGLVLRDGRWQQRPARDLVPGDVVQLAPGDKVPADLRLFQTSRLRLDEAVLTGESMPAEKSVAPVAPAAVIGDHRCIAYSGTLVTAGQGLGIVVASGDDTEIGRISALLRQVRGLSTPLLKKMDRFSGQLTVAILLVSVATVLYGTLVQDYSLGDMVLAAVGLAVAAVPEGLPAVVTITLAIGVQRMAARRAIIRRLPAVETLGAVTVICSDKTGTLTRNEMTVQQVATAIDLFTISGTGYQPLGAIHGSDGEPLRLPLSKELLAIMEAGLLCNDAEVHTDSDGQWAIQGDPTENALLTLAGKGGLDVDNERARHPRRDTLPFDALHRFMATLHEGDAGPMIYVKGAPEKIVAMCREQLEGESAVALDHGYWERQLALLASRGQRPLALARRRVAPTTRRIDDSDLPGELTLLGMVGIIDPPREEAIAAIAACREAGIAVKMITGDHALTALAIADQLGIGDGESVLTGVEIDSLDDVTLARETDRIEVFARTAPEHKLRLVQALQARGQVVAMTGDGVNDAPSLKRADIGVAMGGKGTEVAKEAAEMVLADDNFATIASAVREGRTVYDNIRKGVVFLLPTSVGEALTLLAAILIGLQLPITPVQILWVNMVTAVTLGIAFAFEPTEADIMRRPPRPPQEPILDVTLSWRIIFVSLILVAGCFGLFLWERHQGSELAVARTVAVNTLVMFETFYLFNSRSVLGPVLNWRGLFGNHYALVGVAILMLLQLGFIYLPPLQQLFGTAAISGGQWLNTIVVASSVLWLVELEKALVRWRTRRNSDGEGAGYRVR